MKIFLGGPWQVPSFTVSCLFSFSENKTETKKELCDFLSIAYYRNFFDEDSKKMFEDVLSKHDDAEKFLKDLKSFKSLCRSKAFAKDKHGKIIDLFSLFFVPQFDLIPSDYIKKKLRECAATKTLPEAWLVSTYLLTLEEMSKFSYQELIDRIIFLDYGIMEIPFSAWQEAFPNIDFKKLFREGEFIEIYLGEERLLKDSSGVNILHKGRRQFAVPMGKKLLALFVEEQQKWMKEHSKRPSNFMGKKKQDYEDLRKYNGRYWGLDK